MSDKTDREQSESRDGDPDHPYPPAIHPNGAEVALDVRISHCEFVNVDITMLAFSFA